MNAHFSFIKRVSEILSVFLISIICIQTAYGSEYTIENLEFPDSSMIATLPEVVDTLGSFEPSVSTLPDTMPRPRVGLVLSGGGAKGIAHVGVIKALEDNDIPIDYVTGTSMGAIVGSLYSCGWSPQKMLDFFTTSQFLDWASGTIDSNHIYYYYQQPPTPTWVSLNLNLWGKKQESLRSQIIPTSLISPLPMNIEFLNLYGPYSQQCEENFNKLFVPFRCVASDVYHKHKVVFGEGSLGEAVRASMSFPLVFRPIAIDGVLLYDGGIYDNFPVNVMQEDFNPDFIIGVSVSGADSKPLKGDMYSQVEDMIIQNNDYSVPSKNGIKIQVPVLNFGVLQFDKARTIYEIGYQTGLSMVDSIKKRCSGRVPLEVVNQRRLLFEKATPNLTFTDIKVEGIQGSQANYLKYLFTQGKSDTLQMPNVVNSYYRAVTDGSLSNLVPFAQFGKNFKDNTLLLDATPKRPLTLSVGGFVTTSTNSMLYFSGAYHTLGHNSFNFSLSAWLGQAYFAGMLNAKFDIRSRIPSYAEITGVLSQQKYYDNEVLFYKLSNPMFITENDNYLRASYVWAIGRKMKGYTSIAGGYLSDSYLPGIGKGDPSGNRDKIKYRLGVYRLGIEANSLDNQMYPSLGENWYANLDVSYQGSKFLSGLEDDYTPSWKSTPVVSLQLMWRKYFKIHPKWRIGLMANGMATYHKLNQNYINTLIHATAFAPTPSTKNYFNIAFRSDNYVAAGVMPMWIPLKNLQIRGDFYAFSPFRNLKDNGRNVATQYDGGFKRVEFLGELAAIYNLPFASVSVYGNYLSSPTRNWNFGISIGLFFQAPKLLRL